jgi:nucleoside-diphosphate-sugar epimerase
LQTALIIGGTGFLGSAIAEELERAGWDVSVLSRGRNIQLSKRYKTILADRTNTTELMKAVGSRTFDLVVDCASYEGKDAAQAVRVFHEVCGHYVIISTDYVYASSSETTLPIRESALTQRDTTYAAGKLDCEQVFLESWNESRFPVTILRPPHIMGAGKELGSDQVLGRNPAIPRMLREGNGLRLLAEGQLLIQPVWNREIGLCIAHFAGMKASFGQLFNCAGPDCVTTLRYYEIVTRMLNVPLHFETVAIQDFIRENPEQCHYLRHRIYDTSRLTEVTGYKPHLPLESAIRETLDWMLTHHPL